MEEALVSVILPTYNRARYLPRAVESVLSQEYRNLELIIVDDGSVDNTREVVSQITDKRIVFMRTPANQGVAAARNAGIRRAKGKYIAFQDSDDKWLPGKLEKQVGILENSTKEIALVYHIMSRTDRAGETTITPEKRIRKEIRQGKIFERLLASNYIGMPTVCVNRSVLKAAGLFDTTMPNLEDYDLLLRIAKSYEIAYIDEVLIETFSLEDSINNDWVKGAVSNCMIIKKYEKELKANRMYERKLEALQNFGAKIGAKKLMEEIIQKYCK